MTVTRTSASGSARSLISPVKTRTSIWSSQTLTAAAADVTSSVYSLAAGFRGGVHLRIENGATGPTVAATVEVWGSYVSAGTLPVLLSSVDGSTANDGVVTAEVPLDDGVISVYLVAGGNTGQNVTVKADMVSVAPLG